VVGEWNQLDDHCGNSFSAYVGDYSVDNAKFRSNCKGHSSKHETCSVPGSRTASRHRACQAPGLAYEFRAGDSFSFPTMKPFLPLTTPAAAWLLAGCYQVPVTGRHALSLVDDKEVTKMSIAAFDEMKAHYPISHDQERIDQLQRVGERLQRAVPIWDMPDADWEFIVFDVPDINAFAMAGGKVGVFAGLFKIAENDDQLASVIGHEIAHVTAKHVHEELSQQLAMQTGGLLGGVALMGSGAGLLTTDAIMQVYGLGAGMTGLVFDRKKEKEADHIGLMYMARAGYDPEEAVKVLEKLEEETAGQGPAPSSFTSTHPSNPDRIQQLRDLMPAALKAREQAAIKPVPILVK
jgi:predicted Zn-dependent protease